MEKDLEYFKIMFANKSAISMESIEDIQDAGHWLIEQAERAQRLSVKYRFEREERVPKLEKENDELTKRVLKKDEFQRILNWYQSRQAETGSNIEDVELAVKIVKIIDEYK